MQKSLQNPTSKCQGMSKAAPKTTCYRSPCRSGHCSDPPKNDAHNTNLVATRYMAEIYTHAQRSALYPRTCHVRAAWSNPRARHVSAEPCTPEHVTSAQRAVPQNMQQQCSVLRPEHATPARRPSAWLSPSQNMPHKTCRVSQPQLSQALLITAKTYFNHNRSNSPLVRACVRKPVGSLQTSPGTASYTGNYTPGYTRDLGGWNGAGLLKLQSLLKPWCASCYCCCSCGVRYRIFLDKV